MGYDLSAEACVATVLPPGVKWTGATPTVVNSQVPPGFAPPLQIESVEVEPTDDGREIIIVCFDKAFPPNFSASQAWHGRQSRISFDIPFTVLSSAYDPPASSTAEFAAYAIVKDPGAVGLVNVAAEIGDDVFDLDPTRTRVGFDRLTVTINGQGGLLLDKQVSVDGGDTWGLYREAFGGATVRWRLDVTNTLPSTASDAGVCDALPQPGDGRDSDFALVLAGPISVSGATSPTIGYASVGPAGCADPGATWGPDPAGPTPSGSPSRSSSRGRASPSSSTPCCPRVSSIRTRR